MVVIGITGGVGAGKSRVLAYLKEAYGAVTVEMDAVGRELMEPESACYPHVLRLFPEALLADGRLDRGVIAKTVFGNPKKLAALNGVIHPAVYAECVRRMTEASKAGKPLFVMESAILVQSGYAGICQEIWYVFADREARMGRLSDSRGYSRERSENVMASQFSEEEYRTTANFLLDNSGDFEDTKKAIDRRLRLLLEWSGSAGSETSGA